MGIIDELVLGSTEAKMKRNLVFTCIYLGLMLMTLPGNVSSAYFHQCEFIECYLFPEASLNDSDNQVKVFTVWTGIFTMKNYNYSLKELTNPY